MPLALNCEWLDLLDWNFNMETATLIAILASVFTGGASVEIIRHYFNRRRDNFGVFQEAWLMEMHKLRAEVNYLSRVVQSLTQEVHRLGGNPLDVIPQRDLDDFE